MLDKKNIKKKYFKDKNSDLMWHSMTPEKMCIYNLCIYINFRYVKILNEKDFKEKFISEYKNDIIWPSMTFEVKFHFMKDLHLYNFIIYTKF